MRKISKEEALSKHREMWTAMQETLGDCPSHRDRAIFKTKWCKEHNEAVSLDCYLCEYTIKNRLDCDSCPIDWGNGSYCIDYRTNYKYSPISEILALPERKTEVVYV